MVRISGIIINSNKHIIVALKDIFGVGKYRSGIICRESNIDPVKKVKDLTSNEIATLQSNINKFKVEGDLKREIGMNVKRLVDIKSYRGIRHKLGLPVNGQRTRTNAMTRKRSKSKKK